MYDMYLHCCVVGRVGIMALSGSARQVPGSKIQLADAFTKALPREDFSRYRDWMGVMKPPNVGAIPP
jgi:hypothetical protein